MGVSTFNYTGRKDFLRTGGDNPEVEIKIYDTESGIKFEPFFNFDKKRDFPVIQRSEFNFILHLVTILFQHLLILELLKILK